MTVIPAINCLDFECVRDLTRQASFFASKEGWLHLDIADGRFTFNKTWGEPGRWHEVQGGLKLEVHLMVEEPEKLVPYWLEAGVRRIIVHVETLTPETATAILQAAQARGAEVMLSSNPETPIEALTPFFGMFSQFQVLSVHPGMAGQSFLPATLEKMKALRKALPAAWIEADGGMNRETAVLVKDAGANAIVAASFIFGRSDPSKAYQELCAV